MQRINASVNTRHKNNFISTRHMQFMTSAPNFRGGQLNNLTRPSKAASASEMTYIVSSGALNSTHSLQSRWLSEAWWRLQMQGLR